MVLCAHIDYYHYRLNCISFLRKAATNLDQRLFSLSFRTNIYADITKGENNACRCNMNIEKKSNSHYDVITDGIILRRSFYILCKINLSTNFLNFYNANRHFS